MFIILYVLAVIVSFTIIAFLNINSRGKVWIVGILMGIFGFLLVPSISSQIDALPYLYSLNAIRSTLHIKGVAAAWNMLQIGHGTSNLPEVAGVFHPMTFQATPVMGILMFLFAFLPNPFFLGFIAFIDYFFALKIIELVVRRGHLSDLEFAVTYLIFMMLFVYTNAVGGVRNNLVGVVYGYAFLSYLDSKPQVISFATLRLLVMAILLALIHPFTMVIFTFSILDMILKRVWELRLTDILLLIQRTFQQSFFSLIKPFSAIPFVGSILTKSNQYVGDNITLFISSRANWIRDFARLFALLLILFLVCKYSHHIVDHKFTEFMIMLMCFTIGSIHDQVVFERCLLVMLPLMLPYIAYVPSLIWNGLSSLSNIDFVKVMMLLTLMIYVMTCFIDNLRAGELYYTFVLNSNPAIASF